MRLFAFITLLLAASGVHGSMIDKLKVQTEPAVAELASPVLFPIFQRPTPRPNNGVRGSSTGVVGIRGSSTAAPASIANTSTGSISSTANISVTPQQRANTTNNATNPDVDALSQAMMFTVCNTTATAFDQAYVNWIPGPASSNSSFLQYQLCAAGSLQPRLVSSFGVSNLQNSFGSKPFVLRVDICGAQSEGKVPCAGRVTAEKPCLTGTTRIPVAFDPSATRTTLTIGTLPPATSVVRMCL